MSTIRSHHEESHTSHITQQCGWVHSNELYELCWEPMIFWCSGEQWQYVATTPFCFLHVIMPLKHDPNHQSQTKSPGYTTWFYSKMRTLGLEYLPPLTMTFKPPNVTVNVTVPWDGAPADSEVRPLRPTLRANSFDLVTPHGGQPTWFHLAKQEWNAKQIYIFFFLYVPLL